ncbi:MAG: Ribosomal protein [Candidatus Parcubacteria bacterium]|jgi:ribosomal protein L35
MKTNKAFAKRIRITKKGKLIARNPGQNHYNSKESTSTQTNKKRSQQLTMNRVYRSQFLAGK